MLPVFLALLASAAANPDPIKLFETISAPELDIQSSAGIRTEAASGIRSVLMDQGVALAETTFDSSLEKSRCMARELCKFGANRDTEFAPAVSAFTVLTTQSNIARAEFYIYFYSGFLDEHEGDH